MTEKNLLILKAVGRQKEICLKTHTIDLGNQGAPLSVCLFEAFLWQLDTELLKSHKMG